jgi:hypothetical protein
VFTKRSLIVLLVGVNLFLLALLLIGSYSVPAAYAQSGGRAGDFSMVTSKVAGQSYDVVFILDRPARRLHALYPTSARQVQLAPAQSRDLVQDFRSTP